MNDERRDSKGLLSWATTTVALALVAARQLFPSIDADTGSGALFVLAAWAVGMLVVADLLIRPGPSARPPIFVFVLIASTAASAYQHPALLMLGEWIGVICIWAALRRSAGVDMMKQTVLLILVLSASEAVLTCHQVRSVIPELLHRYRRGDVGMMRDLAQAGVEPGFMFQARLEAGLPWGTFGHTNTLAGFLMLSTPFLLAVFLASWIATPTSRVWIARAVSSTLLVLVLVGLALTKGRSAWIGTIVSFLFLACSWSPVRSWMRVRLPWVIGVAALCFALLFWKGGNAAESLRYRFEYWRGSVPIIEAHPWLGVGWGSFRDHYLEHKLVFSSEEVADPHNFLMEIAACAGIPAAIAYCWWLATSIRRLLERTEDVEEPVNVGSRSFGWTLGIALVTAAVAVVGLGYSSSWTEIGVWGLMGAFVAVSILNRVMPPMSAKSWRTATAASLVGLHVHLSAAGGVGHPGMMLACWALAAAAGPTTFVDGRKRLWDLGLLAFMLFCGGLAGSLSLEKRVIERDPLLGRVRNVNDARLQSSDSVVDAFNRALALTPGDADLWAEKARWLRWRIDQRPGEGLLSYPGALAAFDRALEIQPLRSQIWLERGMLKIVGASRRLTPIGNAMSGAEDFHRAVERYPNSPSRRSDEVFALAATAQETKTAAGLSQSLDEWRLVKTATTLKEIGFQIGKETGAKIEANSIGRVERAATLALEIDEATPHFDKKLLPAERGWLTAVADELKRRRASG